MGSSYVTITNVNGTLYDQSGNAIGSVPTLEQVLDSGDDASGQQILNAGRLTTVSNYGQSSYPSVVVKDRVSVNELFILPNVGKGNFNPINSDGSISIIGTQNGTGDVATLTIAPHSSTSCGVKMTSSSITIGAGGSDSTPSNGATFSSSHNTIRGNWTQFLGRAAYSETNNGVYMIPSAPSVSSKEMPSFEFAYYYVTGNTDKVDDTIYLSYNRYRTNNYAVFPSVYYGYSGSEGTFNAAGSAKNINHVVIKGITNTSFQFIVTKDNDDNVNIYITFLIVYDIENMRYSKSWTIN